MTPGALSPAERRGLVHAGLFGSVNRPLPSEPYSEVRERFLARYPKKRGRPKSDLHMRVLTALKMATGSLTADRLADVVYASHLKGGPVTAGNLVRLSIKLLRKQGHQITVRKGNVGGYVYAGQVRLRGRRSA